MYPEGLFDLGSRAYAWMVPNGSWGESNAGLVVGDGEALLVDTLWDMSFTGEMLEAMRPVAGAPGITHLVNTHSDGDHTWGNALLADSVRIMSVACDAEARELKPASMALLGRLGKAASVLGLRKLKKSGGYLYHMGAPYDFGKAGFAGATRTFQGELTITVGGREVRLLEVGPAHTRGDTIVYVPDARTVFCGDIVFNGCTPAMWAGPVENWIAALDRIDGLEIDIVVPGHGPLCGRDGVTKVKEYFEFVQREVGARFEAGMQATEAAYDIARSRDFSRHGFATWDSAERIMLNTHVAYRHLGGRTADLKPAERLAILWKQGQLAFEMPESPPAVMRRLKEAT
jgi:cyclase